MQTQITIRPATPTNVPQALALIQELAEYENAPNDVVVDVDEMTSEGFGDSPSYQMLVAEDGDLIVGIAVYYYRYSTWAGKSLYLEDLVVTENRRKEGIGRMLFEALLRIAQKEKLRRFEWQVLDWNEPAIAFYKNWKTSFDGEWLNCRLTGEEIAKLKL